MEAIGLGGDENAGRRLTVLRAIDKLDKFGVEGVRTAARRRPQGRERRLHQGRRPRRQRSAISAYVGIAFIEAARASSGELARTRRAEGSRPRMASIGARGDRAARRRSRRLRPGPHPHRPLRGPRPRILHRPGLRGRAAVRDRQRQGPSRCVFGSVGGGGRYDGLVGALPRRAGAGHRLLDRRVAA